MCDTAHAGMARGECVAWCVAPRRQARARAVRFGCKPLVQQENAQGPKRKGDPWDSWSVVVVLCDCGALYVVVVISVPQISV